MENEILQQILAELKNVKESQAVLERDVKDVKSGQQLSTITLNKFDRNLAVIEQGQTRLEGDLNATKAAILPRLDSLSDDVAKIAVTQENVVLPKLELLFEGHATLESQIKRISVFERMEDDISTLKTAVRFLSQEVEKLKEAM